MSASSPSGDRSPFPTRLWQLGGLAIAAAILTTANSALACVYRLGSQGPAVAAIQRSLGMPADGRFGLMTETAVTAFQSRQRLTPDGVVGTETLQALGLWELSCVGSDSNFDRARVMTPRGPGINLFANPGDNPRGFLPNGTIVDLSGRNSRFNHSDWVELSSGGWVNRQFLQDL